MLEQYDNWDMGSYGGGWDVGDYNFEIGWELPDVNIGIGGGGSAREIAVSIVNSTEYILQMNLNDYRQGRITLTTCVSRFDSEWARMVARLQQLGAEGQRAIADRQSGGKFDWFNAYRPSGSGIPPGGSGTAGGSTDIWGTGTGTGATQAGFLNQNTILLGAVGLGLWFLLKRS